MEEAAIEYWKPEEYAAGLCTDSDVGTIKPPLLEARRMAQRATTKALKALVEVAEQNDDLQAKVKAAQAILDRGWGKPEQHTSSDNIVRIDNMPWVSAQRLTYRLTPAGGDGIADATPRTSPDGALQALPTAPSLAPPDPVGE